jgi:hypothetical protein
MMCSTSFSERERRSTASPSHSAPAYGAARVGPNGQGEIRDLTFENQSFRASGLSLVGNSETPGTQVLDGAVALTGDYIWNGSNPSTDFRPLRDVHTAFFMGRPSKLTPQQQTEDRRRRAEGATLAELARSYDVGKSTISRLTA